MNLHTFLVLFCLLLIGTGCGKRPATHIISGADYDPECGADSYQCRGDNPHSPYYINPDFYSLKSNRNLTIIPHFKTMQQTTEWSCGDVCALLVVRHFHPADTLTEWDLAMAMHSMTDRSVPDAQPGTAQKYADYGTRLEELYRFFSQKEGFRVLETNYRSAYAECDLVQPDDPYPACDCGNLYPTFDSPASFLPWLTAHLQASHPVIVEWSDWDGHWVVIIGVDNNGTPDFTGDDILVFADPYDTSDHCQDGYSIVPLERFFYSWKDRAVAPKPYQLQPFLVIAANE